MSGVPLFVAKPPSTSEILINSEPSRLLEVLSADRLLEHHREYLHWDKLQHLEPPSGFTREEWWWRLKTARQEALQHVPLTTADGESFGYTLPDQALRLLHFVDQRCSGEIAVAEVVTNDDQARQRYLVNSLMEEAIRSSQLEGASTSRRVAKELLRSGRPPQDRSELMIANNYRALQFMRDSVGAKLTASAVLELNRILTEGTLDDPGAAGRLQTAEDERVQVFDRFDGELLHSPPPAAQLEDRLGEMCEFANETSDDGSRFVHPVVRAIVLHFWLAYDHPFKDGNGRTARALFFWRMRESGYWLAEYLPISKILREAPGQYTRSYLLTETDGGDLTYFLLSQLDVIHRAVEQLHRYLRRKTKEIRSVESHLHTVNRFNHRQLAILSYALRNPSASYTFYTHAASHSVTHETARTDLNALEADGLLVSHRQGRKLRFWAVTDLPTRLEDLA